ncbi:hypothetical protein BU17DRAFT_102466 [Hysterangium stoloniferum]|nr:hypothetical protein BU17DRAFT_102466 [Hysterangium stoloniferum]
MSAVQFQSQQSTSMITDEEPLVFSSDVGAALQQDSAEVSDIEKLRRLKETILAGQHPYFRAIPQPDALASLYLGPHPASLPPKDYGESHFNGPNIDETTVSPVQSHTRSVRAPPVYAPEDPTALVGNSRVASAAIRSQTPNLAPSPNLSRAPRPHTPQSMPTNAFNTSGLQHHTAPNGSVSDSRTDTQSGRPNVSIPPKARDFGTTPSPLASGGPKSNTTLPPQLQRPGSVQMRPTSATGTGPNAEQNRVPQSRTVTSQDDSASANKIQPIINDGKDSASFREGHTRSPAHDRERERPTYPAHDSSPRFESSRHPPPDRRDLWRYGPRNSDTRYDRDRDWSRGRDGDGDRERERERDRDRERERLRDRLEYDRSGRPPTLGDRRPPLPPSGDVNAETKSVVSPEPRLGFGTRPPPSEQRRPDISPSMEHRRTDVSLYPDQRRPEVHHAEQRPPEMSPRVEIERRRPEGPPHPELRRSEVLPHPDQRPLDVPYNENRSDMPSSHPDQQRTEPTQHSEQKRRSDVSSHREQVRPDIPQHEQRRPGIPPQHDQRRPEIASYTDSRRMDTDVHDSEPPASQSETQHGEITPQLEPGLHDVSHPRRHPEPSASRPPPSAEQRRPEPGSTSLYPQQSPHDRDRFRVPQGASSFRSGPVPNATVPESPHRENHSVSTSSAAAAEERSTTDRPSQPDQHQRPSSVTPALRSGLSTSEDHPNSAVKLADRGSVRPLPGDNNAPRSGPPDRRGPPPPLGRTPLSAHNRPGAGPGGHDEREAPRPYYPGSAPPPPSRSVAGAPRPPVSPRRPIDHPFEGPRDRRASSTATPYRDGPPRSHPEDSRRQSLDNNHPRRTDEAFYPPHPPPAPGSNNADRRDEVRQWRERYPPSYSGPEANRGRDRSNDRPRGRFPDNPTHIHPPRGRPPQPPAGHNHASWGARPVEIAEKDKDREGYEPWNDRKFPPRGSPPPPPPPRWEEQSHAHKGRPTDTYDDRFVPRDIAERGRYPPAPSPDVPMRDTYRDNPRVRPRSPSPTGRPAGVYDDAHRAPKRARDEYDAPPPPPGRPPYYDEARREPPTEFGAGPRVSSPTYFTPAASGPRDSSLYGRDRAPEPYVRRDMPPPRSPPFYPRERYPPR